MKKFEIIGIKPPGTICLPKLGVVHLDQIDDRLAEKLHAQGVPYIRPKQKPENTQDPGEPFKKPTKK